ncbi:zinc finger domain-containing protein [Microbacterium kribbense]
MYGRGGKPCPRCGRPIVRASFMNRSSHCRRRSNFERFRRSKSEQLRAV